MRSIGLLGVLFLGLFGSGAVSAQDGSSLSNQIMAQNVASAGLSRMPGMAPPPRAPWTAIGRINRRPGGFCSGTLIAWDRVLTTANCMWNKSMRQWFFADDLHFLAGYHLGGQIEHRRVVSIEIADNIEINRRGYPKRPSNDWAVLTLDRPIAASHRIRPIAMIRLGRRPRPGRLGPLVRAGFSPLRPHALTRTDCKAVAFFNRKALMHSCSAVYADSGLPIFAHTDRGWRVLGLQMMTYNEKKKANGIGMALLVSGMSKHTQIHY